MTEFFKNNPIALRHCVLYEFLRKKSAKNAFTKFCETVGDDVIGKEEFHSWLKLFEKGKFDDNKESITDMKDVLRNDKYALRACILYESLKCKMLEKTINRSHTFYPLWTRYSKKWQFIHSPSYFMFENFCETIGDDVMNFLEFDFCFYRFSNGNYELKFEKDKDKKIYKLSDMPIDIIGSIVEYLDMFDRLSLAKTPRSLHTFIDDQKIFLRTLELKIVNNNYSNSSKIKFDEEHSRRFDDWREAIMNFKKITENPKLHLHTLLIDLWSFLGDPFNDEKYSLNPSTHQLHVKKLSFRGNYIGPLLHILPYLKPGYLTTIKVVAIHPYLKIGIDKIAGMEQWKKAQYFSTGECCMFTDSLSDFYHIKEFSVVRSRLSVEDIRDMKETLFKSPILERCSLNLYLRVDESAFEQEFGEAVRGRPNTFDHPIPNSNEYFEIILNERKIEIARKMR